MKFLYLFDPLCGWCYAASPAITTLASQHKVDAIATGLFANTGKVLNAAFAQHAWQNDQRIAQLTGLPFSEKYYQNVLLVGGEFNSFYLSMACYLLKQTMPSQLLPTLAQLQAVRYVDGSDTSQKQQVQEALIALGKADIAKQMDNPDSHSQTNQWLQHGQHLAQQLGVHGTPNLLAQVNDNWVVVPSQFLYQHDEHTSTKIQAFLAEFAK